MSIRLLRAADCSLEEFRAVVEVETDPTTAPHAATIDHEVPVYDASTALAADRDVLLPELASVLHDGPGILVLRGVMSDAAVDAASDVFERIIAEEKAAGGPSGDHFAKPGANDRIWNAHEKLCRADPEVYVDYVSNEALSLVPLAWLGPGYQITTQVNVVNPGGAAQSPHRDYHLGFLTDPEAEQYLSHVHRLSPALTLQGAVAHCDMPVETGPTMYLPHSQKYEAGYVAWRRPEFIEYFAEHKVQLAVGKGDAVWFNPALFHAAGENVTSDVRRMANLFQVCSAFTQAMERLDRAAMVELVEPILAERWADPAARPALRAAAAATADGYAFPGNLDEDQPTDGLAPPSQLARLLARLEG